MESAEKTPKKANRGTSRSLILTFFGVLARKRGTRSAILTEWIDDIIYIIYNV